MKNTDFISYLRDEMDEAGRKNFEAWLAESPENAKEYSDFKRTWKNTGSFGEDYHPDVDLAWEKVRVKTIHGDEGRTKNFRIRPLIRIAASVIILLSLGSALFFSLRVMTDVSYQAEYFSGDSIMKVKLPDQSEVWLNKNTSLALAKDFSVDKRNVHLEGEAFFEVEKDPDHPFSVSFGNSKVNVLGTSFDIKSREEDEKISVVVATGKVAFHRNSRRSDNILLTPGQGVTFFPDEDIIKKKSYSHQNYLAWKTNRFRFEEQSLKEVFETLADYYGSEFIFEGVKTDGLAMSGNFPVESLADILEAIELTFDLEISAGENNSYTILNSNKN